MFRGRGSSFGGRGRGRGGGNSRPRNQPRGLFKESVWYCDCTPRLPAEHFKVKKDGPNHGRWFYTCQQKNNAEKQCGFFLWDDDAKPREEATVLSGRRTEPGVQEGWNAGRARPDEQSNGLGLSESARQPAAKSGSPPPPYSSPAAPLNGKKRSAREAQLNDVIDQSDSFDSWSLTRDDEERLARAADSTAPITPHKARKTESYPTPATTEKRKLPWVMQDEASHVNLTGNSNEETQEDYFTPSKRNTQASSETLSQHSPETPTFRTNILPMPASTPSPPTRNRDALINPADDSSSLTAEVLGALSSLHIPPPVMTDLRVVISKHDLITQGVKNGRDISRLALKRKNSKIVELQAKIAGLEAERELERAVGRMGKRPLNGREKE